MESKSGTDPISFDRAVSDPSAVFSSPQQVIDEPTLSNDEKIEILRRWAYDADLLAVAESEGMGGGEPSMQGRVLAALCQLEGGGTKDAPGGAGPSRPGSPHCD